MKSMTRKKLFLERWKSDYGFKTLVSAFASLLVTVLFALYNGFLGAYHASVWYAAISLYYFLLSVLRGSVILAERKNHFCAGQEGKRDRAYMSASILLLTLNASMIGPITMMVRQQKPVRLTLIPAIAMATYTTYKIILASINFKRSRKSANSLVRLLRTISFIDALVSILTLQNTLVMVSAKGDSMKMLPLTAFSSAVILAATIALSVTAIVHGMIGVKKGRRPSRVRVRVRSRFAGRFRRRKERRPTAPGEEK